MATRQNTDYGHDIQKLYLEIMLSDSETFVRCQSIFDEGLFDRKLQAPAQFVNEYVTNHNAVPTFDMVNATTHSDLSHPGQLQEAHYDWLLEEFETFCRHRALEQAILKSADLLEKGEYGTVEGLIKDAVQIGLQKDLGTDYWRNPRERLEAIKNNRGQISTGWETLDRLLYGGFQRGELEVLAGSSGSGKSIFLANLGINWTLAGMNVLYVTLELSEELVSMRMDSMITGIPSREILRKIDDVEMKVVMAGKKSGAYQVKYMPSGSNVNQLRSYMKEYQTKYDRKFDVLLVDYLDLLNPIAKKISAENLFIKDKYVSEELRNLAMETNCLLVSASQLNRCLTLDTHVYKNGIPYNISQLRVGDYIDSNHMPVQVIEVLPITRQLVFGIRTQGERYIECSADHKFPTATEVKSINSGLSIGDDLVVGPLHKVAGLLDKIVSIEEIGIRETIDINVSGNRLFYANGILTHNSAVDEIEYDHSNISGGLSKINTADNVFGIFTSRAMRERGEYQLQLMKTRNSSGVGSKVQLDFDVDTLRITDSGKEPESNPQPSANQLAAAVSRNSNPGGNGSADSSKLREFLKNNTSDL